MVHAIQNEPVTVQHSAGVFEQDTCSIKARVERDMQQFLGGSSLNARQKVAVGCRILARDGHAHSLAGQVTARADENSFWTTSFANGLREATASNLVRFDRGMTLVEGEGMASPAVRFHLWIYQRRPDVQSIVHTHPPHVSALSMTGQPLVSAHMDAMMFHEACAYLRDWPGVPLANEEGEIISSALGDKPAILLAHHGLLTAGSSIEHAIYLAVCLEHAAKLQLLASSNGEIRLPRPELAREARQFLTKASVMNATFNYWARQIIREDAGVLE
jgi:L-fuculose-phosphate aldolase